MLKNNAKETLKEIPEDGVVELLTKIGSQLGEFGERLDEIEKKGSSPNEAQVIAAKCVYMPTNQQLSEMTNISLRMVNPLSLADACASVLDDDVQDGLITLGQIRRLAIYRLLRSVKGNLLEKGAKLAEQQEVNRVEGSFEEADLGKGL